ncbi:TonB-dependent siderophore receptor [Croceicoccus sp. Ery15]|uniref:TonB-dependent receptor plug domain-containing protein n=1 Tax=Croceicoccus sp. Ery15 TaxID=1703338 RepID=UPI001E543D30|nr:TonB-dependent receptor [Croceicoccus sp. Ery15]
MVRGHFLSVAASGLAAALVPAVALAQSAPAAPKEPDVPAAPVEDGIQEPQDTPAPIIVTGKGLDASVAAPAYATRQIGREQIVAAASGRIEDVLSSVAGFQQYRRSDSRSANPSAQGVTLRSLGGNATSRALVLLDGVPMADPFFGYVPLSAIAPERLGAIRVTRGGGSGSFGAGALTGTIELESAGADMLGPVSGHALVNDRGESEAAAAIAPRLGSGFVEVSGRWDRGQGFYTTPADQRVDATSRAAYDSWSAGIRGVAPIAPDTEVQARMLVWRDDRTLRFDGADSATEGQDASLRIVGRGEWSFDVVAYVQARNFSNVVISSTRFSPVLDQYNTPSTGIGGKFELRPPETAGHQLRLGVDYRSASGTMMENAISAFTGAVTARRMAGGRNEDIGIFAEDDWTLGALVLTGGVRADRTAITGGYYTARDAGGSIETAETYDDRSDWTVTWRGGAVWQAGDGIALRGAAYRGIRLPTLNELYRPFVVFPVTTQANAALGNEELLGFEAGIDLTPLDGIRLSLTAFDNRIEHAIANVTIAENLRQRQNLPAIDAQGLELDAVLGNGPVSLTGSLAYTDAAVDGSGDAAELDGLRPAQTPRLTASATLAYEPSSAMRLAATLRHVGKQYEDDLETDALPAATTFDAFARVRLVSGLSLVLRAENLLDETIVTRNSGGSIDLGVPRTVWGGVQLGF